MEWKRVLMNASVILMACGLLDGTINLFEKYSDNIVSQDMIGVFSAGIENLKQASLIIKQEAMNI